MFIFVFLNLICLSIILSKIIWYSENSRRETDYIINEILGIPKRELDLIREEQDAEELNHTCEYCIDGCEESDEDDNTHDSMPDLVEAENKQDDVMKEVAEESDDVSIEHVSAEDLDVIKDTLGYIQKTKEMLIEIKSDLEKKID